MAGCATPPRAQPPPATGDASWRILASPGTARYQLVMGEVASGATPFQRVAPRYPPELLATCPPPVEVQALLIVDPAGKVEAVRVADEAMANAARHRFIDAVRVAARQWQFEPLQITHWAGDADGNTHAVDSQTRPFSLTYAFRFECHAGTAAVSTAAAKP